MKKQFIVVAFQGRIKELLISTIRAIILLIKTIGKYAEKEFGLFTR
jgi:hypothetical protein